MSTGPTSCRLSCNYFSLHVVGEVFHPAVSITRFDQQCAMRYAPLRAFVIGRCYLRLHLPWPTRPGCICYSE